MKIHRRFLTLLETLIVLFILSLFLGLVGIKVNKAVHEQRFRSEVSAVVDALRTAQYLMLIMDNDVYVKFKQTDDGILMTTEATCPLSANWEKLLFAPKQLRTIHIINFRDLQNSSPSEPGIAEARFLSSGYVMSQGIMRLATADASFGQEGLQNYICFPGYPSAIASVEVRPEEPACYSLMEEGFVQNMTNMMVAEIQALTAAKKTQEPAPQESPKKEVKGDQKKAS